MRILTPVIYILYAFGCGKPPASHHPDASRVQVRETSEAFSRPATKTIIARTNLGKFQFERNDPNQLRIGFVINEALRKKKNQAMAKSRALKLVPSRAVPELLVEDVKQLDELDLTGNKLTDITCLSQLTHFNSLYLSFNNLTQLKPLEKHINLLALTLDENQLDDLAPLACMSKLNLLSLNSNKISDLRPIAKLVHLKYLYLGENQIGDIDHLKYLDNLIILDLSKNQLTNVKALGGLTKLQSLNLFDNEGLKLAEIQALQRALPNCEILTNSTK